MNSKTQKIVNLAGWKTMILMVTELKTLDEEFFFQASFAVLLIHLATIEQSKNVTIVAAGVGTR
jgi:hypothetical protein